MVYSILILDASFDINDNQISYSKKLKDLNIKFSTLESMITEKINNNNNKSNQ